MLVKRPLAVFAATSIVCLAFPVDELVTSHYPPMRLCVTLFLLIGLSAASGCQGQAGDEPSRELLTGAPTVKKLTKSDIGGIGE